MPPLPHPDPPSPVSERAKRGSCRKHIWISKSILNWEIQFRFFKNVLQKSKDQKISTVEEKLNGATLCPTLLIQVPIAFWYPQHAMSMEIDTEGSREGQSSREHSQFLS